MCRVFENFPLTSVQLESQKCASICPSVRLLNFFGQTTQVYVVIPHGVVTHHQHQECFKIKNILTKPHSLPVPPKSWSWVQNDQKWVFIKCKIWLCLTQLESPRKGGFTKSLLLQTVQTLFFRQSPYVLVFLEPQPSYHHLKIGFFSEPL